MSKIVKEAKGPTLTKSELKPKAVGDDESKTIGKLDMARILSQKANTSIQVAQSNIEDVLDIIVDMIKDGKKMTFKGLGSFHISETQARNGVNPRTLQPIVIPASKKIVFTPSQALKDAVKQK